MTCLIYVKLISGIVFWRVSNTMLQKITKRHAIIEVLHAGRTAKEIIDFFNHNKDLVYRIKKQFEACDDPETFTGERKTHNRCSDAIRSPEFVIKVKQRIQDNPFKSMAALAFKINVNKSTISRTVAKDLNMKSYCFRKLHLLTAALMERRLIKETALLNVLKYGLSGNVRFFSDEKNLSRTSSTTDKTIASLTTLKKFPL